jgi:hypothetical protein
MNIKKFYNQNSKWHIFFILFSAIYLFPRDCFSNSDKDLLVRSKITTVKGGIHSTTRGTIRLVFIHKNKWLVFHGNPRSYHFSDDGIKWSQPIESIEADRGFYKEGNYIFSVFPVEEKPNLWISYIVKGFLSSERIKWGTPHNLNTEMGYYLDLKKNNQGFFTITGRTHYKEHAESLLSRFSKFFKRKGTIEKEPMMIQWMKSKFLDNIQKLDSPVQCINHISNTDGSVVHENIALKMGDIMSLRCSL